MNAIFKNETKLKFFISFFKKIFLIVLTLFGINLKAMAAQEFTTVGRITVRNIPIKEVDATEEYWTNERILQTKPIPFFAPTELISNNPENDNKLNLPSSPGVAVPGHLPNFKPVK